MKLRWIALLAGLGLLVLLIWLGTLLFAPALLSLVGRQHLLDYAATGEMFGATSSLFAGLGAFAVVVVLIFDLLERKKDLRHRQEEFRPFVSPVVKKVEISEAIWQGGHFNLIVSMEIEMVNSAVMPALNLTLDSAMGAGSVTISGKVELSDAPLVSSPGGDVEARIASVQYSDNGHTALSLFRQFEYSDKSVEIGLEVRYTSLNGVKWKSEVTYVASCARPADQDIVRRVGANGSSESIGRSLEVPGSVNIIVLSPTPKSGTWVQSRED